MNLDNYINKKYYNLLSDEERNIVYDVCKQVSKKYKCFVQLAMIERLFLAGHIRTVRGFLQNLSKRLKNTNKIGNVRLQATFEEILAMR